MATKQNNKNVNTVDKDFSIILKHFGIFFTEWLQSCYFSCLLHGALGDDSFEDLENQTQI
jgi:hypothetical protein